MLFRDEEQHEHHGAGDLEEILKLDT